MENPIKMDDLGENPLFLETPICHPQKSTTKEAIYQSVAHASPAGAIIRVGEQVHPFKRLGGNPNRLGLTSLFMVWNG